MLAPSPMHPALHDQLSFIDFEGVECSADLVASAQTARVNLRHGMISRILVSGVSGPIGAALLRSFNPHDYEVVRLVRGQAANGAQIKWDPAIPISPDAVSGF